MVPNFILILVTFMSLGAVLIITKAHATKLKLNQICSNIIPIRFLLHCL